MNDAQGDGGPSLRVPRQEELPLVETLTAEEAARAAASADTITAADLPVLVPDTTDLPPAELRAVIEGLLFVATRPLSLEKLQECLFFHQYSCLLFLLHRLFP